jgi:hypothetical protein
MTSRIYAQHFVMITAQVPGKTAKDCSYGQEKKKV